MKTTFVLFLIFITSFSFARKVTLNDLISKIKDDHVEIGLTTPKPFVKEISLRLDDDHHFQEGDIDVEARFMIDNLSEYKLKKKLQKNQRKRKTIVQKISKGEKLNQVIQLYISLALYRKKYDLLLKKKVLLNDKVKVYKRLVNKGRAEATDYLEALEKLSENETLRDQHKSQIKSTVTAINTLLTTNYSERDFAKEEKLVSMKYINKKLNDSADTSKALSVRLSKYNIERMQLERNLEVEADNKILDFIGIGFNQNQLPGSEEYEDENIDSQRLSIKLGLNIPLFDSKMERADNTIDSFLKRRKALTEHMESASNMVTLQGEVKTLAQTIKRLERSKAIKEAKRYLRIYSSRRGTSPLKILDINTFLIESEVKLNEYKSELYVKFYQYMYEIGRLKFNNGRLEITG